MDRQHTEQDVRRFVDAWIGADQRADTAFLERTLADDFVAVGPLGFLLTKQQWIERHQSGELRYNALTLDDVTVRRYDGTALVIGRQVQDATYRGNPVEMAQLRTTLVLVQRGGGWHLVGVQMSSIGQPPGGAAR